MDSEPPASQFLSRYPALRRSLSHAKKNPQLALAAVLFCIGLVALAKIAALAGALFGAGAALLGAWVTEYNNRRASTEERVRRQIEARHFLAPELHRAILRVLYIHERAIPNFVCASTESTAGKSCTMAFQLLPPLAEP